MTWRGPEFCRYVDAGNPNGEICNRELQYKGRGPRPKWCPQCKALVDAERNRRNVAGNRRRYPQEHRLTRFAYRQTDQILRRLAEDEFPQVSRGKVLDTFRAWEDPLPNPENHVQAVLADTLFIRVALRTPWNGKPTIFTKLDDLDNVALVAMTEDLGQFGERWKEKADPPLLEGEPAEETLGPFLELYEHARTELGWDRTGTICFTFLRVQDNLYVEYGIQPPELEKEVIPDDVTDEPESTEDSINQSGGATRADSADRATTTEEQRTSEGSQPDRSPE